MEIKEPRTDSIVNTIYVDVLDVNITYKIMVIPTSLEVDHVDIKQQDDVDMDVDQVILAFEAKKMVYHPDLL